MAYPPYFRVLAKRVWQNEGQAFVRGVEYKTADFAEGLLDVLAGVKTAAGNKVVNAIEFYEESKAKVEKAVADKPEQES